MIKNIKIPEDSCKLAEFIGVIIGDGCIRYKPEYNQYYVEIIGNQYEEKEYFAYLKKLIKTELNLDAKVTIRERAIRMKIYSKIFVEYLINVLKLPYNKKGKNIFIPKQIISNKNLLLNCIRGITDTDGSLFLSNKGYRKDYPTIEITSTSKTLAFQLKDELSKVFRIGFRSFKRIDSLLIYIISINGEKMVDEWYNMIGFSNLRNIKRYQKLKKHKEWVL